MPPGPADSRAKNPIPDAAAVSLRGLAVAAATTVVVFAALLSPASPAVRAARDDWPKQEQIAPPSRSAFAAEIRRALTVEQDRMIELATRVFRREDEATQAEDDLATRKSLEEAARARYEQAKLAREAAEVRVKEYTEGTFPGERSAADAEIRIAQEEISSSRAATKRAEDHFVKIKQASKGSVEDLSTEFAFEGKVAAGQLAERRAEFYLEAANSKKKILVEYTKPKRERELLSDVEKARSDERAKRATWELEQAKTRILEREAKPNDLRSQMKRSLVLLDQATVASEEIRRKLDEYAKPDKATDALRKEIRALLGRVTVLVDEAGAESSNQQIDKLKPPIHQAADRYRATAK